MDASSSMTYTVIAESKKIVMAVRPLITSGFERSREGKVIEGTECIYAAFKFHVQKVDKSEAAEDWPELFKMECMSLRNFYHTRTLLLPFAYNNSDPGTAFNSLKGQLEDKLDILFDGVKLIAPVAEVAMLLAEKYFILYPILGKNEEIPSMGAHPLWADKQSMYV